MEHSASVRELAFSPDGKTLVTASFRNLLFWSLTSGRLLHTLERHEDFVRHIEYTHDGRYLVTCGADKLIVVWDVRARTSIATFAAHCPLDGVTVAHGLSSVLFRPHNVGYLGVLQPNAMLRRLISGEAKNPVPQSVQCAQAYALTFSNTPVTSTTSRACVIL